MAERKVLVFNPDLGLAEEQQTGDVAVLNGALDLNGHSIAGSADPINPEDLATKGYVDAQAGSGGGAGSGLILGHGAPTDPPPAANYLFFDLDTATVYPAI